MWHKKKKLTPQLNTTLLYGHSGPALRWATESSRHQKYTLCTQALVDSSRWHQTTLVLLSPLSLHNKHTLFLSFRYEHSGAHGKIKWSQFLWPSISALLASSNDLSSATPKSSGALSLQILPFQTTFEFGFVFSDSWASSNILSTSFTSVHHIHSLESHRSSYMFIPIWKVPMARGRVNSLLKISTTTLSQDVR
jgi:hypothetical protein